MPRIALALLTLIATLALPALTVRADDKDEKIVVVIKIPSDQLDRHPAR